MLVIIEDLVEARLLLIEAFTEDARDLQLRANRLQLDHEPLQVCQRLVLFL